MIKLLKYPKTIIVLMILITVFFTVQLPNLKMNNSVKIFLPKNHPAKIANDKMEKIYGSSDVLAIGVVTEVKTILSKANLDTIASITQKLEKIPNITDVTSITNADYIKGDSDGMTVEELGKNITNKYDILSKLKSWDIYDKNLYSQDFKSTMITAKLKKGLVINEKEKIYSEVKGLTNSYSGKNLKFYIAGTPAVNVLMGDNMRADLQNLIPYVIIVVILALYLSFKRIGGVVLPLLTVIISTIWTLGAMAIFNINLTMVSTVIPVLLVAVGSAYGIHLVSHYYDEIFEALKEGPLDAEKHKNIIMSVVIKVGAPVAIAGLTTMVGFGSLATSEIVPIKQFGIFTAVGVFAAIIVAVTLTPAILLLRAKKLENKISSKNKEKKSIVITTILELHNYFEGKKIRIILVSLLIVILSGIGTKKIITDSVLIEMFKNDTDIRQSDRFLNSKFNGTNILNIMVDGKNKGDLTNPKVLVAMDDLSNYLTSKYPQVGKVTSFADFIQRMNKVLHFPQDDKITSDATSDMSKEFTDNFEESSFDEESSSFGEEVSSFDAGNTDEASTGNTIKQAKSASKTKQVTEYEFIELLNQSILESKNANPSAQELVENIARKLNYKGEAFNEIPSEPSKYNLATNEELKNLISQYLLLYSGSLDDLINNQLQPSKARMMVQIKTGSNFLTKAIKTDILEFAKKYFPPNYDVTVAGHADMELSVNDLIVSSQLKSIFASILVVFIIIALLYKSIIAGIFGIIPLSISLIINFGLMGFMGIKLDIATSMVASIAIGIGVDYTVHFLSAYRHERLLSSDLKLVTQNTLLSSGKAIIFNAISVSAGFIVLSFSNFSPLISLGMLITLTMITSSVASMTILPAMLNLFKPKFISK